MTTPEKILSDLIQCYHLDRYHDFVINLADIIADAEKVLEDGMVPRRDRDGVGCVPAVAGGRAINDGLIERLRELYYSGHHDEAFDKAADALAALAASGGECICPTIDDGCIIERQERKECPVHGKPSPSPQGNVAPDLSRQEGVKCEPSGMELANGLQPQGNDGLIERLRYPSIVPMSKGVALCKEAADALAAQQRDREQLIRSYESVATAQQREIVHLDGQIKTLLSELAATEKENAELQEGLGQIADKAKRTRQHVVTGAEGETYGGLLDIEGDARSLLQGKK